MAQQKKNIARLVLQGISILGIFFGFSWFGGGILMLLFIERDDLAILCILLITSGALLVLGPYLMYDSYLMFRGRAFGAIKSISAFLAIFSCGSVVGFAATSVSGELPACIGDIVVAFAPLLVLVLVYSICVKLLKRLLQVAYSPEEISETQRSADKQ